MISVEEALEKILSHIEVLPEEEQPILESLGQVLAEDVRSPVDVPPLDNSAMDGYAVRSADTRGASEKSPRYLEVIDTLLAGALPRKEVVPGTAVRIMTGAPVPSGADSVVAFEQTDQYRQPGKDGRVGIYTEAAPGLNIRLAGEDVARGALVLNRGTIIKPGEVGVLASVGRTGVKVVRRPVVTILATGDELVEIGKPLPRGKIYNSNSYSVAALVWRYGGIPQPAGIATDSEGSLRERFAQGGGADMLITTGGVSEGDYDLVKNVLAQDGEIVFWKIRMKPGKPQAFGVLRGKDSQGMSRGIPLLGLAGNPVSAMVGFELFARPAMLKMMGKKNFEKPTVEAVLEDDIPNKDRRRVYARVVVEKRGDKYFARLTGSQGSGVLTSMSLANGLAVVTEDQAGARKGEVVTVMMLDWEEL